MATSPHASAQTGAGRILFSGEIYGEGGIFVMDADGTNQTRLTSGNNGGAPVWSPNGCRIVFRRGGDVYVMDADGSHQALVTRMHGTIADSDPRSYFSPDGSRILFRGIGIDFPSPNLFIVNVDGSNLINLTNNTAWLPSDWAPYWSPDGSKILFASSREPRGIYVMNADGADAQRLWAGDDPAWSPDGSKIAFLSDFDIVVMNADGTNVTPLTDGSRMSMRFSWSPDGSRIAFETVGDDEKRLLEVMNADGTERSILADQVWFTMGPAPPVSWSPNGSRIVFTRMQELRLDIYAVDADGFNLTRLTTGGMSAGPAWSPTARCETGSSSRPGEQAAGRPKVREGQEAVRSSELL
jgi:TolB protein